MNSKKKKTKVFGIGLNKTGTKTLSKCGKLLGYKSTSFDRDLLKDYRLRNDLTLIKERADRFDMFEDWPWPLIYREMDEAYPGSKFILTVRIDEESWLKSLKKHSMRKPPVNNCRKLAFGYRYPHKYEKEHLEIYREHNKSVREYFKGRSNDFLEVCWEKGHGFREICEFLGEEIPDAPFPHQNKAATKGYNWRRYYMNRFFRIFS